MEATTHPAPAPAPAEAKPVRYQILCCPKCGSEKVRVTSTQRPIRHHKCKECDAVFKTIEEKQRPDVID